MKKIRRGDNVIVLTGKCKGQSGVVRKVIGDKVKVEGINLVKKHVKPNPNVNETGGIKAIEAPLHVSNVAILNPKTNKADRVGFKFDTDESGNSFKRRFYKSDGEYVDLQ